MYTFFFCWWTARRHAIIIMYVHVSNDVTNLFFSKPKQTLNKKKKNQNSELKLNNLGVQSQFIWFANIVFYTGNQIKNIITHSSIRLEKKCVGFQFK